MKPERISRNQMIWQAYYKHPEATLDTVGQSYGVTRERIRQVIAKVDRQYFRDEISRLKTLVELSNISVSSDDIRIVKAVINKELPEKWYINHIRLYRRHHHE